MTDQSSTAREPRFLQIIEKITSSLENILIRIAGFCLAALIVVVFVDVLFRQVIKIPLMQPFEISVFFFIWSVFLAGAVATKRQVHFVVDFLPSNMPYWFERWLPVFVWSLCLVFSVVVLFYGVQLANIGINQFSPMNEYRLVWAITAVPVAGGAMVLFTIEHTLRGILGLPQKGGSGLLLHGVSSDSEN